MIKDKKKWGVNKEIFYYIITDIDVVRGISSNQRLSLEILQGSTLQDTSLTLSRQGLINGVSSFFSSCLSILMWWRLSVQDFIVFFKTNVLAKDIIATLILFAMALLIRFFAVRAIIKNELSSPEFKRRWIVHLRNSAIIVTFFGVIAIWGSELRAFAVSLVAIAAAIVIATKELILCVLGGILKASFGHFDVGDRIEVNNIRGDVISHNLFVTLIHEIGPGKELHQFTGRVITLPNSLFLSQSVVNETATGKYVVIIMKIPLSLETNWAKEREKLLISAREASASYIEDAKQQFTNIEKKEGVELPSVEPRVSISFPDVNRIDLILRVPIPAKRRGRMEQQILERYKELTI